MGITPLSAEDEHGFEARVKVLTNPGQQFRSGHVADGGARLVTGWAGDPFSHSVSHTHVAAPPIGNQSAHHRGGVEGHAAIAGEAQMQFWPD